MIVDLTDDEIVALHTALASLIGDHLLAIDRMTGVHQMRGRPADPGRSRAISEVNANLNRLLALGTKLGMEL